ncbi:hypothetical protein [Vitiosangium sp. GDMCC 1.1324]|uniref:hypothetical protein n=1 Tax=Vitiosangium sp. (strain GDMCC 1.1324) TaxID=2138576 RepID=UPI000D360728|nr:hypothetical protein [Vitiosangium sp. GDMCC 1.1324]PTL76492.1 hypothetical protein DAT35_48595 [Vitiosangium sp. GDMCC 1.1324]
MRHWMKQLGTGIGLIFTLGVSSTALAYPPQCTDECSCESSCDDPCYTGTKRSTCNAIRVCLNYCGARNGDPQASLTQDAQGQQDAQEQQDGSQDVCTEQARQPASAKS